MKKIILAIFCLIGLSFNNVSEAAYKQAENVADSIQNGNPSLLNKLGISHFRSDLIEVHGQFKTSLHNYFSEPDGYTSSKFAMDVVRLQVSGHLTDWLSYAFRQRLNESSASKKDGTGSATDLALITMNYRKWELTAGKYMNEFGGFEYHGDCVNNYDFPDYVITTGLFHVGMALKYHVGDQILKFDTHAIHNGGLEDYYGIAPKDIKEAPAPFSYTLMWDGKLFDGKLQTKYSVTLDNEAEGKNNFMLATGTRLYLKNTQFVFDYYYSHEKLDSRKLVTKIINNNVGADEMDIARNINYNAVSCRIDQKLLNRLSFVGKYIFEQANQFKTPDNVSSGKYYQNNQFVTSLEYRISNDGLRFYSSYMGRFQNYNHDAETLYGVQDQYSGRLSFGFLYRIQIL